MDETVLAAAMVESHPDHVRSLRRLHEAQAGSDELVVALHTWTDLYSLLTTLPVRPRISPDMARRLVRENVETRASTVVLDASDYTRALDEAAAMGLTRSAVVDVLTAWAAAKAGAERLLTLRPAELRRHSPCDPTIISEP